MQGTIAQALALVMTGNALLQGREVAAFWPRASVFQFCREVEFHSTERGFLGQRERTEASDPTAWFALLARRCRGLRIQVAPGAGEGVSDRHSVGFVGGGARWLIEELRRSQSAIWEAAWGVGEPEAADRRIWDVTYVELASDWPTAPHAPADLDALRGKLDDCLAKLAEFARRNGAGFVQNFQNGRAALHSDEPWAFAYHKDLAPPDFLSLEAQQLLAACQAAWVFGGMGSWNDGAYEPDVAPEGDALSDRLFGLLQQGAAAAANSTFPVGA